MTLLLSKPSHCSRFQSFSVLSLHGPRFSTQPLHEEEDIHDSEQHQLHVHHRGNKLNLNSSHRNRRVEQAAPKIGRLVLVRHGQSEWNVTDPTRNLTARFTGWADIGLTQQGIDQAIAAGRAVQFAVSKGILPSKEVEICDSDSTIRKKQVPAIDVAFCSLLKRASDTMNLVLNEVYLADPIESIFQNPTGQNSSTKSRAIEYKYRIPIIQSWRLNERHYGALVGLSKEGAERLYGKVRLSRWRDSWDVPPPPMPLEMIKKWGKETHCQPVTIVNRGKTALFPEHHNVDKDASRASCVKIVEHGGKKKQVEGKSVDGGTIISSSTVEPVQETSFTFMPPSESLRDTYERFIPLWIQGIAPHLRAGKTVLVVGHANTIRSMLFAIDPDIVTKENSKQVKIPSALPLVYEFVDGHSIRMLDMIESEGSVMNGQMGKMYVEGRECSNVISGNLRVLRPHRHSTVLNFFRPPKETIYSDQVKQPKKEMKYQLNGIWVETEETKSVSFCTEAGRQAGEQDIA
eukprot:CCRYP_006763-RA/>CCRYP_006763-RA protein AED:0.21 eAED:0.21 QI:224/1/1/1/1/1/2/533/516